MRKCPNCNGETKNPRFCSRSCSASFNNRKRSVTEDTKRKICESLGGTYEKKRKECVVCNKELSEHQRKYCSTACFSKKRWEIIRREIEKTGRSDAFDSKQIKHYLEETKGYCEKCNLTEWLGEKMSFDLHHINGNNRDHRLDNVLLLCPNCHRHEHGSYNPTGIRMDDDVLLGALTSNKTISAALASLGMGRSKDSYDRCRKLLASIHRFDPDTPYQN